MSRQRRIEALERRAAEERDGGGWVPPLEIVQAFVMARYWRDETFDWPAPDPAAGWEWVPGAEAFRREYRLRELWALATTEPEPPAEPPRRSRPTSPPPTIPAAPSSPAPPPPPPVPPVRLDRGLPDYLVAILKPPPDHTPSGW